MLVNKEIDFTGGVWSFVENSLSDYVCWEYKKRENAFTIAVLDKKNRTGGRKWVDSKKGAPTTTVDVDTEAALVTLQGGKLIEAESDHEQALLGYNDHGEIGFGLGTPLDVQFVIPKDYRDVVKVKVYVYSLKTKQDGSPAVDGFLNVFSNWLNVKSRAKPGEKQEAGIFELVRVKDSFAIRNSANSFYAFANNDPKVWPDKSGIGFYTQNLNDPAYASVSSPTANPAECTLWKFMPDDSLLCLDSLLKSGNAKDQKFSVRVSDTYIYAKTDSALEPLVFQVEDQDDLYRKLTRDLYSGDLEGHPAGFKRLFNIRNWLEFGEMEFAPPSFSTSSSSSSSSSVHVES